MTNNLEQAAANLLNAINNPSPRPLTAATTCREAALDELNVHFNRHEDRHVDAATVHAILEVAEQLRIRNLIALASSNFPHVEIEADDNIAPAEAADTLVAYREEPGPELGHGGPSDSVVIAALRPDVAAALGVQS